MSSVETTHLSGEALALVDVHRRAVGDLFPTGATFLDRRGSTDSECACRDDGVVEDDGVGRNDRPAVNDDPVQHHCP